MADKWKCPHCGNINPEESSICLGCNAQRPAPVSGTPGPAVAPSDASTSGESPTTKRAEWELQHEFAIALYKDGQYEYALAVVAKSLETAERVLGPDHLEISYLLNDMAEMQR
jgi:hypothetical protein